MHTLTASELLEVWERGLTRTPAQRVLALLAAAHPDVSADELAGLPIGRRDARLLRLRERLFGPQITAVAECPACGEPVESTFGVEDLRLSDDLESDGVHLAQIEDYRASFRLPNSSDLLALTEPATAREALLARCLVQVSDAHGVPLNAASLPDDVIAGIAARMAAADPQAEIELQLACPACAHRWAALFDIASFLWKELHAWAVRTLRDVHTLARAYGWREADVLALSPTRRQIYLEFARQ